MRRADAALVGAVAVHLVGSLLHGLVHGAVPVGLPPWHLAGAAVALFAVPVAGVVALARGDRRLGGRLVAFGTLSGLLFEAAAHFGPRNPDHVSTVTHVAFAPTALVSTLATGTGAVVAAWYLRRHSQGRAARSCIESRT